MAYCAGMTSFVGRAAQLDEVTRRLSVERAVTLTGVGGAGKTRLALAHAASVRNRYADGVWLAELAPLRDGEDVVRTVAHAVGIRDQSTRDSMGTLVDHLRAHPRTLLVLDNCEHLLDECAGLVAALLDEAAELRVLATSRSRLSIPGESVLTVPPLTIPPATVSTLAQANVYESVQLLVDRARGSRGEWEPTEDDVAHLVSICHRLDGLPAAIELAAVRLRSMSLADLDTRLTEMFRLLNRGGLSVLPHHQTMHAIVDWSHQLCTEAERRLWARLSTFRASFDLAAAETVCASPELPSHEIADVLHDLVDKSLVVPDADRARFRLLEPVRQYGEKLLGDETPAVRQRMAHHYLGTAAEAARGWYGPGELAVLRTLRADMPNYRAALDVLGGDDLALQLAADLARTRESFYNGWLPEIRAVLEQALQATPSRLSPARLGALSALSFIMLCQGEQKAVVDAVIDEALRLVEPLPPGPVAQVDFMLGLRALLATADAEEAFSKLSAARDAMTEMGPDWAGDRSMAVVMLANTAALLGDAERARKHTEVCYEDSEAADRPWGRTWALWTLAITELRFGTATAADQLLRQALREQVDISDRWGPTWSVEGMGWIAAALGQPERAAELLGAASAMQVMVGVGIAGMKCIALHRANAEHQAREALGDKAFRAWFAKGLKITDYDQGIALALSPGQSVLTPAQTKVVRLVAEGRTNQQIATALNLSIRTVESHIARVQQQLDLPNRVTIAVWWQKQQQP